jgi:hypothetical protein
MDGPADRDACARAAQFAIENTRLEGGTLSPETLALLEDWVSGEISDDELLDENLRRLKRPLNLR